jgi:hypothetical protein
MATIKIERPGEYNNRMRNYKIFLDYQQTGTIANGEIKELTISTGQHKISAKIDWCSSREISFSIGDNETKNFKVGGFRNGDWIMRIAVGLIILHFIIKITLDINYIIFLLVPVFFLFAYYLTIGRKKYLTLQEIYE